MSSLFSIFYVLEIIALSFGTTFLYKQPVYKKLVLDSYNHKQL